MKQILFICLIISLSITCSEKKPQVIEDKTAQNAILIDQLYTHFNNHDWAKMASLYSDTAEMKDPAFGTKMVKMSRADIVKKYQELNAMIPDVRDDVVKMYHSGNHVIVEFVSTGTAPDKSKFELPICSIYTLENGKIAKDFTYYDNFEAPK
jgi:ketosteroid isomerase-like protein